jgi:hypothetical protein
MLMFTYAWTASINFGIKLENSNFQPRFKIHLYLNEQQKYGDVRNVPLIIKSSILQTIFLNYEYN